MRESLRHGLVELLERLVAAAAREPGPSPAAVRAEVRAALAASGAAEHRVVAEWDAHRGRHDVTVIVGDDELGGALLVEVRGTRDELPLTLLAAQRWSERDLLRVDGQTLRVDDVIAALDFLWSDVQVATRLIDMLILRAEVERAPVSLSDEALQDGVDAFRTRNGLVTVDGTQAWLRERGLSLAELEDLVAGELELAEAGRRRVSGELEAHLAAHGADYDRVEVARVIGDDADLVAAAARDIVAGRLPRGLELRVCEVAARDLSAGERGLAIGDASAPAPSGDGRWTCAVIVARRPAAPTAATRTAVEAHLVAQWLAAARARAVIEWNWGTRAMTDALTAAARAG